MLKYWVPARSSSKKDRDGYSKKEAQTKTGSEVPEGSEDRMVSHYSKPATWRIGKTESDLKLSKTLANAQLAHPAGLHGRSPPLREQRRGTPICASILSAQESAPLLTEGNTRQCFPKNNEQDCFNRVHLDTTFLSYFRIRFLGRQIIPSCPCTCLRISYQQRTMVELACPGRGNRAHHVLARHLLIFSHVHCSTSQAI